jgi:4-amino-4-deoxy-L-arabinose transferase-like glycosyltransferase
MATTDLGSAPPRPAPQRGLHRPLLTHLPFAVLLLASCLLLLLWRRRPGVPLLLAAGLALGLAATVRGVGVLLLAALGLGSPFPSPPT